MQEDTSNNDTFRIVERKSIRGNCTNVIKASRIANRHSRAYAKTPNSRGKRSAYQCIHVALRILSVHNTHTHTHKHACSSRCFADKRSLQLKLAKPALFYIFIFVMQKREINVMWTKVSCQEGLLRSCSWFWKGISLWKATSLQIFFQSKKRQHGSATHVSLLPYMCQLHFETMNCCTIGHFSPSF